MDSGESFLLPYDVDGRTELNIKESALAAKLLNAELSKINAKTLLLVFDMCRTEPFGSGKSASRNNTLGNRQARDFVVVPSGARIAGPSATLTLYSCSPLQRSWEWLNKGRGYFSYFFEEGLRREAADSGGTVRVRNLLDYLTKAVPGAVAREEGQEQKPYYEIKGADALDLVLASGRPPGNGGATAVPVVAGNSAEALYQKQFQRGLELSDQGKYDEAYLRFEAAAELKPQDAQAVLRMGNARYYAKKYDDAVTLYIKVTEIAPADETAFSNLGSAYYGKMDYTEAEKYYRKAMEISQNNAYTALGLGDMCHRRNNDTEAEQLYRKAVELDPKIATTANKLGLFFCDKKDYTEAEKYINKAIELDPKNADYQINMGNIHFDKGAYAEAEKFYRKAIELNAKEGVYHVCLAGALFQQNRRDEAKIEAQKAIDLGCKDNWVYKPLGLTP